MAAPLVSVVVPAHNAEATLAETLDSLLAQDMNDWEAIVVDDASADRTATIAGAYASRDPRFRVLRCSVGSAAAARNSGIAAAGGRWLMFLDADDWVAPSFLGRMAGALAEDPEAIAAYCGYRRVMPDGARTPTYMAKDVALQPFETFARRCAVAIHALLIDRRTVVELGGFDLSLRTCEDWDLWQRVARLGTRWLEVDEPLSYYRTTASSLSRDSARMIADARIVIERGFSEDARVANPAQAHARGADDAGGRTADAALAWFALWNAASDCAAGRGSPVDRALLRHVPAGYEWARMVSQVIFDGVMVGSRLTPERLAGAWASFGDRVTALVADLGAGWCDPVAARRVQYHFEQLLLDYDDLSEPRRLALTLGLRVDARRPEPTPLPDGVDRIYAYLTLDGKVRGLVQFGALGTVTKRHWTEVILDSVPPAELGRVLSWRRLAALPPLRTIARLVRRRARSRPSARFAIGRQQAGAAAPPPIDVSGAGGSHCAVLSRMKAEAATQSGPERSEARGSARAAPAEEARNGNRRGFWDRYFATEDPWNYRSPYEQEKYRRQLEILPEAPIGRALELACAEGHFTTLLAPRVGRLAATDIAAVAVQRARQRCRDQTNIEFGVLDLSSDDLPQGLDLIVCSEVLYYLDDVAELRRVAGKLVSALAPGGSLVTAHAFILRDDMERTAFDWDNPFGAAVIADTLACTPGLALERSLQSELYRIDRFRKLAPGETAGRPSVDEVPIEAPIEIDVARQIVRGGAGALRSDVARSERRTRIPVLMYHGVAEDGPEALARYRLTPRAFARQAAWLRANGFHAVMSEQLEWFIANRHPFVGRPVMISFDDGFQNFADQAWPILRAHDLTAEVFLVTDLVGQSATWDAHLGAPTPLMDAQTIGRLAAEGVFFGSHTASHRAIDGLSTHELAAELIRSRAAIEQWTGRQAIAFAAPFSVVDRRLALLAKECGYRVGFGDRCGPATLEGKAIDLPRMEVRGDRPFEEFVRMMEAVIG